MNSDKILFWGATCIAIPTIGWIIMATVAGAAKDASQDTALVMIQTHIIESRAEDREWKKSVMSEIGKMGDGFHAMGKEFSELKGVLNAIEFRGGNSDD